MANARASRELIGRSSGIIKAKGEGEMSAQLGKFVYWAATIVAALICTTAVSYFANANMPIIRLPVLVLAVAFWLVGWACRYLFADRKDQR